jgi:hypothetical protein
VVALVGGEWKIEQYHLAVVAAGDGTCAEVGVEEGRREASR